MKFRIYASLISLGLISSLVLPFDAGLKGNVVEAHPIFWLLLAFAIICARAQR